MPKEKLAKPKQSPTKSDISLDSNNSNASVILDETSHKFKRRKPSKSSRMPHNMLDFINYEKLLKKDGDTYYEANDSPTPKYQPILLHQAYVIETNVKMTQIVVSLKISRSIILTPLNIPVTS